MAVRTETETLDLVRAITKLGNQFHTYLTGTGATDLNALETQIAVGDQVAENSQMTTAMNQFISQLGNAFETWKSIAQASAPALGRLAGSPDLTDFTQNIDTFAQYMVDNSNEIEKRGYTKDTAATVVGSGAGLLSVGSVDLSGDIIDYGHVEDFVFECDRVDGVSSPEFTIKGSSTGKYPWEENGSGLSSSYNYDFGTVITDFASQQPKAGSGDTIRSIGASSGAGNLIRNGDFETPISGTGTDKLSQWTISTGDATITEESTDPINGAYSLDASADFVMDSLLTAGRIQAGTMAALAIKVERKSSATGTLTVKLMDRDEGVTHGTLSITIGSLTNDVPVVLAIAAPFDIPVSAKELKVQVELASLAVGTITFDDVMLANATLINGYTAALFDGTTQDASGNANGDFKKGDTFTVQTTSAEGGTTQKYFANMGLGRYFRSDVAATANWEDWS